MQYSKSELTIKYHSSGVLVVCVCDCVTISDVQCYEVVDLVSVCGYLSRFGKIVNKNDALKLEIFEERISIFGFVK